VFDPFEFHLQKQQQQQQQQQSMTSTRPSFLAYSCALRRVSQVSADPVSASGGI
jgi:hypothetical protein